MDALCVIVLFSSLLGLEARRLQSMTFSPHALPDSEVTQQLISWPPAGDRGAKIKWTNLHPSSKKVCFYYQVNLTSYNVANENLETQHALGCKYGGHHVYNGVSQNTLKCNPRLVGPLAFGESLTKHVRFSNQESGSLMFAFSYKVVAGRINSCPPMTQLTHLNGEFTAEVMEIKFVPPEHFMVPFDWTPSIVLKANGRLWADLQGGDFWGHKQGLFLDLRNEAPLVCEGGAHDPFISGSRVGGRKRKKKKGYSRIGFSDAGYSLKPSEWIHTGLSKKQIAHFQCDELVIDLKCTAADASSTEGIIPTPKPKKKRKKPKKESNFETQVDLTGFLHSLCSFDNRVNNDHASLTVTIVGDGSQEFPFNVRIEEEPPSKFSCHPSCEEVSEFSYSPLNSSAPQAESSTSEGAQRNLKKMRMKTKMMMGMRTMKSNNEEQGTDEEDENSPGSPLEEDEDSSGSTMDGKSFATMQTAVFGTLAALGAQVLLGLS